MKHLGDITKIDWFSVEPVDVVTGGSPCQDLSVAGKRAGLAGERSGLFMEQIRCVKELRRADELRGRSGIAIRPRFMVWENVPGAFSSNRGNDFRAVLEETVKIVCEEAPDVPMPDGGWPKAGCLYDEMGRWSVAWRVHDAQFWGVPQRRKRIALVADFGGRCAPEILFERKGLSGDFEPGKPQGKEAAGGVGDCVAGAVTCYGLDHVLLSGGTTYQGRGYYDNVSGCLKTQPHGVMCLNDQAVFCAKNAMPFDTTQITSPQNGSHPHYGDPCHPLAAGSHAPAIAIGFVMAHGQANAVTAAEASRIGQTVRRLTPLECERLQGYPDGWTDIGDWVDSKGKRHKEADSPRYKALGNSIALPFWMWLLKRISAQYERDATLGSLFDGIGGFPLCWERINGKGSARWASEIEEFPIAVTKRRFAET